MSTLYEDDILLWSEQQAALLKRHAAVANSNAAIDWDNIIEEIESVGNEQRFAVFPGAKGGNHHTHIFAISSWSGPVPRGSLAGVRP